MYPKSHFDYNHLLEQIYVPKFEKLTADMIIDKTYFKIRFENLMGMFEEVSIDNPIDW